MYEALSNTFPENTTSSGSLVTKGEGNVLVYPNPSEGFLNIQAFSPFYISIFNASGKRIYQGYSTKDITEINLDQQLPGLYFVWIKDKKGINTKKIILK